ncbi:hypothetical protein FEM54_24270 [Pseudomonas edaphica]|uniref:Uncharacterized protein n=1 Tax=Pseudomonas edaphica TaxID=2006980 RepID=A0ABY2TZG4_9PSED|nr:hypothetical protein FEM54_24270 [Pseudomonas edaphica]
MAYGFSPSLKLNFRKLSCSLRMGLAVSRAMQSDCGVAGRGASQAAFPRRAWERSDQQLPALPQPQQPQNLPA